MCGLCRNTCCSAHMQQWLQKFCSTPLISILTHSSLWYQPISNCILEDTLRACRIVIFCVFLAAFLQRIFLMSHHTRTERCCQSRFSALVWFVHTKISFERDCSISFYKRRGLKTKFWEWLWLMCAVWMEPQSITSYLSCHQHA